MNASDRPDARPVVALVGEPGWAERMAPPLAGGGFYPVRWHDRPGYLTWLIDHAVALVLVDGDSPGWQGWVPLSRTEQATRRIPVLVTAREPDSMSGAAQERGAAACLPVDDLDAVLCAVRDHARGLTPAQRAELECRCQDNLPPLARLGVERFNAGDYYGQHDAFEAQWVQESGPVRELYRAVLQVGVAYYHILQGNHRGALRMLRRSVQWLAMLPPICQGIDVRQLSQDAAQVRAALENMDPADIATFDRALLRPLRRVDG